MDRRNRKRAAKYTNSERSGNERVRSITIGERKGLHYVQFAPMKIAQRKYFIGADHPPFIAQVNARTVMDWAKATNTKLVNIAGDKAFFETLADAVLCRVKFA